MIAEFTHRIIMLYDCNYSCKNYKIKCCVSFCFVHAVLRNIFWCGWKLLTLAHWNAAPSAIGHAGGCLIPNQGERRDTFKQDCVQEMRDISSM